MHDKKSSHVGNHGGAYLDENGMSKQFTYIDHDAKTKVSAGIPMSDREKTLLKESLCSYRNSVILKIIISPPSLCPGIFQDFTIKGQNKKYMEWNEKMLRDEGLPLQKIVDMWTLLSKNVESARHTY